VAKGANPQKAPFRHSVAKGANPQNAVNLSKNIKGGGGGYGGTYVPPKEGVMGERMSSLGERMSSLGERMSSPTPKILYL